MLILSRKLNESIVVDGVTITVLHIDRHRCRLGITAPKDTPIRRAELAAETMDESAGEPGEADGGRPEVAGG